MLQSLAIIDYIAENFPGEALLPSDPAGRARARAIAQYVVCEIQPLQNTRLDAYMTKQVGGHLPVPVCLGLQQLTMKDCNYVVIKCCEVSALVKIHVLLQLLPIQAHPIVSLRATVLVGKYC